MPRYDIILTVPIAGRITGTGKIDSSVRLQFFICLLYTSYLYHPAETTQAFSFADIGGFCNLGQLQRLAVMAVDKIQHYAQTLCVWRGSRAVITGFRSEPEAEGIAQFGESFPQRKFISRKIFRESVKRRRCLLYTSKN